MANKTKKSVTVIPAVVVGSHSTRTTYPDGRIEFVTHWDALVRDVEAVTNSTVREKTKKVAKITSSAPKKPKNKKA